MKEIGKGKPISRQTALGRHGGRDGAYAGRSHAVSLRSAGRNLGRATVLELARRGADVVVNARSDREEAGAVAREAAALERLGRIDILINNAGFRPATPSAGR